MGEKLCCVQHGFADALPLQLGLGGQHANPAGITFVQDMHTGDQGVVAFHDQDSGAIMEQRSNLLCRCAWP